MATTAAETRELLDELKKGRVRFLLLQFTDLLGVNKAVEVPASRFEQALAGEVLFDGSALEGFARVEEADALLVPDLASFRVFPWESAAGQGRARCCRPPRGSRVRPGWGGRRPCGSRSSRASAGSPGGARPARRATRRPRRPWRASPPPSAPRRPGGSRGPPDHPEAADR